MLFVDLVVVVGLVVRLDDDGELIELLLLSSTFLDRDLVKRHKRNDQNEILVNNNN